MHRGERSGFLGWWGLTILLGLTFLACTAKEWHELIFTYGLTISRNMFGSAYFTLVGFHAAHVTVGIDSAVDRMGAGISGKISQQHATGMEVISWYWHFVDGVWVVVLTLYISSGGE